MIIEWLLGLAISLIGALIAVIWHQLNTRIEVISNQVKFSDQAVLSEKVKNLEMDYELLHQWKNVILDQKFERQSENFMGVLRRIEIDTGRRLDYLERKIFNGVKS